VGLNISAHKDHVTDERITLVLKDAGRADSSISNPHMLEEMRTDKLNNTRLLNHNTPCVVHSRAPRLHCPGNEYFNHKHYILKSVHL